ncbi:MAG TPA: cation transporter, partial [Kiloniellales bacterium]
MPDNERVALAVIASITGMMAFVEGTLSIPAGSTALLADALIFLQLSINAAFALQASTGTSGRRRWTVQLQGGLMMTLGALVCAAAVRGFMLGTLPHPWLMIAVGAVALAASMGAWAVMLRQRRGPSGLNALWRSGRTDAVSNVAVIAAGVAVAATRSNIPDLVIGGAMATLFVISGWRIA